MMEFFTKHPSEVGESYFGHLASAARFAFTLALGAVACLLHAVIPALFKRTASGIVTRLHEQMVTNRARGPVDPR